VSAASHSRPELGISSDVPKVTQQNCDAQNVKASCVMLNLEGEVANQYSDGGTMYEVILKRFEQPDEIRSFEKGKFELIRIGGMTIGRATYQPGWKWSEHVGKAAGLKSCGVEHVGIVLSGIATAAMDDGRVIEMKGGDIFYIEPGHDSWVVGDEPYVSLHLMGASDYASKKK
jgi:hypothetical protein